jgi:putative transposase
MSMARVARVVVAGMPHHVTQRGNRRMQTFFGQEDYRAYLALLVEWSGRCGLDIWAYCLMPNHVHLVAVPRTPETLAKALTEVHRRYTQRVNFREGWRGYLWQGRFSSFVMDQAHLLAAAAYVERNPVKAGMVERAEDWAWSSAKAHAAGQSDGICQVDWLAELTAGWVCSWREYLDKASWEEQFAPLMERHASTGRPLGDQAFLQKVGQILGRDLLPQKRGPKPKKGI